MRDTLQQFDALQHYVPQRDMVPTNKEGIYVRADEARKIVEAQAAEITTLNSRLQHQSQNRVKAFASEVEADVRITQELKRLRLANAELNARLGERTLDHIKASARDVAEIQRLRVELDALKRRIVKPLKWVEATRRTCASTDHAQYEIVRLNKSVSLHTRVQGKDWEFTNCDSLDHAKRIAEDLHRDAVLALLETEEKEVSHD